MNHVWCEVRRLYLAVNVLMHDRITRYGIRIRGKKVVQGFLKLLEFMKQLPPFWINYLGNQGYEKARIARESASHFAPIGKIFSEKENKMVSHQKHNKHRFMVPLNNE